MIFNDIMLYHPKEIPEFCRKYLEYGGIQRKYLAFGWPLKNTSNLKFYTLKIPLPPLSVYMGSHPSGQYQKFKVHENRINKSKENLSQRREGLDAMLYL